MGRVADDLSGQVGEEGGRLRHCRMYLLCDGDEVAGYNMVQHVVAFTKRSTAV